MLHADFVQVDVARNDVGIAVADSDERLAEIVVRQFHLVFRVGEECSLDQRRREFGGTIKRKIETANVTERVQAAFQDFLQNELRKRAITNVLVESPGAFC